MLPNVVRTFSSWFAISKAFSTMTAVIRFMSTKQPTEMKKKIAQPIKYLPAGASN